MSVQCLYSVCTTVGNVVGVRGKAGGSGSKRQLEAEEGTGGSLAEQQGKGNKRCRLGPTEQLRVVVRQILAGVSPCQACPFDSTLLSPHASLTFVVLFVLMSRPSVCASCLTVRHRPVSSHRQTSPNAVIGWLKHVILLCSFSGQGLRSFLTCAASCVATACLFLSVMFVGHQGAGS